LSRNYQPRLDTKCLLLWFHPAFLELILSSVESPGEATNLSQGKLHFRKQMTTDTKLRLHNVTSKASLCYGSENWIINKRDAQKLEVAQMRFLRPLLGLTRLDRQRNPEIRNILKVDNIVEDIKQYQRRWVDHLERMDRSRLPKLAFQYQPRGWRDRGRPRARWKDQEHLELQRNRS
jgi:hypothetical protein